MKTKFICWLFCWLALVTAGCSGYLVPEQGSVADPEKRIVLTVDSETEQVYQTPELKLVYSLRENEGSYEYRGRLHFDRSLTDSFPIIKNFFLKLNFLDEEGRVLATLDVTPFYSVRGQVMHSLEKRKTLAIPAGSTQITFSYYGIFVGDVPHIGEEWQIFEFPFH
ncbi:hypothetical protein [Desulforhopalus singaporensis]|nr:hypothetical protein [Desulforhopalus singaporensis]